MEKKYILNVILWSIVVTLIGLITLLSIKIGLNNQTNPEVQIKTTEKIRGEQYYTLILNDTAYDYVTLLEIDSILKTK